MAIPLRVLNVEDSEDDALLLQRQLSRAGYAVTMERVDTPEGMQNALDRQQWDVVIADYVLPRFNAPAALAMVKERVPGLPFILVSGAVGEETVAMAALRAGAHDYMVKNSLARFVHAIALVARVIPEGERAAVHLALGQQYLEQSPESNLAKATYHGEEALTLLREGDDDRYVPALLHVAKCYAGMGQYAESVALLRRYEAMPKGTAAEEPSLEAEVQYQLGRALERLGEQAEAAVALDRAERWFERLGLIGRAQECRERWHPITDADGTLPDDRGPVHLERGRYFLLTGDLGQAVTEAIMALHLAGTDSARCFDCYMLLLKCAQNQGNGKEALHFGLSARMMAMEAQRHDLGYIATEALAELVREMGDRAGDVVGWLEQEYRKWNMNIWHFLPDSIWGPGNTPGEAVRPRRRPD